MQWTLPSAPHVQTAPGKQTPGEMPPTNRSSVRAKKEGVGEEAGTPPDDPREPRSRRTDYRNGWRKQASGDARHLLLGLVRRGSEMV